MGLTEFFLKRQSGREKRTRPHFSKKGVISFLSGGFVRKLIQAKSLTKIAENRRFLHIESNSFYRLVRYRFFASRKTLMWTKEIIDFFGSIFPYLSGANRDPATAEKKYFFDLADYIPPKSKKLVT